MPTDPNQPRIAVVLPPGMCFSRSRAASVDLCAHDLVLNSQYRDTTQMFGPHSDDPFTDVAYRGLPAASDKIFRAALMAELHAFKPNSILVHQQFRLAGQIADLYPGVPVAVFRHNSVRQRGFFGRLHMRSYLRKCSALYWCSDFIREDFLRQFPMFRKRCGTVYNALDLSQWTPAITREQEILFVGRSTDDKGLLEFATALTAILPHHPTWRGRIIVSHTGEQPDYTRSVKAALVPLADRVTWHDTIPFEAVKHHCERAAIMVVPSKWAEPFGRTAIEAHAGGAALVSSGRGGLREASGTTALFLPDVTAAFIAGHVSSLINDPDLRERLAKAGTARASALFDVTSVAHTLTTDLMELEAA